MPLRSLKFVAAILGVLVLGEHLTSGVMLGFGLVPAGSVLATRAPEPRPPLESASEPA